MAPAAASAAQGSATSTAAYTPTPSSSASTYSEGTLKFLKLQTGRVETHSSAVPTRVRLQNTGLRDTVTSQPTPSALASNPMNRGNSASPAPAGAGTPVKKL